MAEVSITVGGHAYRLACRDGEEPALREAGRLLNDKVAGLKKGLGSSAGEARLLLMAGLLLAGDVAEQTAEHGSRISPAELAGLDVLVERVEKLAQTLEQSLEQAAGDN